MVRGSLCATAVVEVLVGALVEALPHRRWPWVVVVGEVLVQPVVPLPESRVWHRQTARGAVPQLGGTQRDDVAREGLQLDVGRPGARDGLVESHPHSSQGQGYAADQVAPRQGCDFRDGIVHLGADAMHAGDVPEHPGGLGAHRGRVVVGERAYEGNRYLLAPCWHPCELQGPVVV